MVFRISKFIAGTGHLVLTIALIMAVLGYAGEHFAQWLVNISIWGASFTLLLFPYYLERLEDRQSKRMIFIPMFANVPLAIIALVLANSTMVIIIANVSLIIWLAIYLRTRARFKAYFPFHRGHLPNGIWMNPPVQALQPGDIILCHGPMADKCRNAVGHADLVLDGKGGKLHIFSSMIESGTIYKTARALLRSYEKGPYPWVIMRLRTPLSEEQNELTKKVREEMMDDNKAWTTQAQAWTERFIKVLWLPAKCKAYLLKRWMPTGYDQFGKFWGGERKNRWTCVAAALHLLRKAGVPVDDYGTGAFGLIGEFNPVIPVRVMQDSAYRWLTEEDQRVFTESQDNCQ